VSRAACAVRECICARVKGSGSSSVPAVLDHGVVESAKVDSAAAIAAVMSWASVSLSDGDEALR